MLTSKPTIGPESQSTRAWAEGADGEERVGGLLDGCDDIACLHDRRIPGSKANIDHIALGPAGIFVIDAKRYAGSVERRDVGGLFRTDERLYVAGRDRTKLVDGMAKQVEAVRAALGNPVPQVRPVLCFVGAEWPRFFARLLEIRGVTVVWPARLAQLVAQPGPLTALQIAGLRDALARSLRPA